MTNEEKKLKLEQLSNSKEFLDQLRNAESKDEIQAVFARFGLSLTKEEIDAFAQVAAQELEGELTDAALENVAGGGIDALTIFTTAYSIVKDIVKECWNAGRKFANWAP